MHLTVVFVRHFTHGYFFNGFLVGQRVNEWNDVWGANLFRCSKFSWFFFNFIDATNFVSYVTVLLDEFYFSPVNFLMREIFCWPKLFLIFNLSKKHRLSWHSIINVKDGDGEILILIHSYNISNSRLAAISGYTLRQGLKIEFHVSNNCTIFHYHYFFTLTIFNGSSWCGSEGIGTA